MRGKVSRLNPRAIAPRITPAHAGKRQAASAQSAGWQDHPRPCGEKQFSELKEMAKEGSPPPMRGKAIKLLASASSAGSPPPMRGKADAVAYALQRGGITPAHAGKSGHVSRIRLARADHPRPCGEKNRHARRAYRHMGSPPPMRGKAVNDGSRYPTDGITPAHAGKSYLFSQTFLFAKDHPRPCGEKLQQQSANCICIGSPPPMRGKAVNDCSRYPTDGITPAHAGKSYLFSQTFLFAKDHPRPCGEKPSRAMYLTTALGSPPPMRGKVVFWHKNVQFSRITPAHAGKRSPN